jgi:hypothetical protein
MKSPEDLRGLLRRQWENADHRERRLLGDSDAWPISLSIGVPSASELTSKLDAVKKHVEAWRNVKVGEVAWEPKQYRASDDAVDVPVRWLIKKPSHWLAACGDSAMKNEFETLAELISNSDPLFHSAFIRRRSLWQSKPVHEIVLAATVAMQLNPGAAAGKPLRLLSLEGVDTKFFERNESLVRTLLDIRFDGEVSRIGLETFLDAFNEKDHWLLVLDLDGGLLPFRSQRVSAKELGRCRLPGQNLVVIENECCSHLLPAVPDTLAVLGAGFDLAWLANPLLPEKQIAYWGDVDTWGLSFLSRARGLLPRTAVLLMDSKTFEDHRDRAVPEPITASPDPAESLTPAEQALYRRLLTESRGRLEQEYLPRGLVHDAIHSWLATSR